MEQVAFCPLDLDLCGGDCEHPTESFLEIALSH